MMHLRLLGIANMRTIFSQVQRTLCQWQMCGVATSTVTGLLLGYTQPRRFSCSFLFWIKLVLMVMAGINALAFHRTTYLTVARWDVHSPPFGAKLAGALGLALWAAVVVSGRLIAYDWFSQ